MTKADIINEIAEKTGVDKADVTASVEAFFSVVKSSMSNGNNIYIRGFGSFINKKRKKKIARNISRNTALVIDEHFVPSFKPAKIFVNKIKNSEKVKQLAPARLKGRPELQIVDGKLLVAAQKEAEAEAAFKRAQEALRNEKASRRRLAQADFGLAVIAYNRFSHDVDRLASRYESFMEELQNILQRQAHLPDRDMAATGAHRAK